MKTANKTLLAMSSLILLGGCMPKMTIEQMKEMRPQRPAELDRLNMLVGKWEGTGTCKMAGIEEELTSKGSSVTRWDGDGWYLVSEHVMSMGELGEMKGFEVWSWDAKGKCYRTYWVDNMGGYGYGKAKYDDKCNCFCLKARTYSPWGKARAKGCMTIVDNDTMEGTWQESAMMGLIKTMSWTGTMKRVK